MCLLDSSTVIGHRYKVSAPKHRPNLPPTVPLKDDSRENDSISLSSMQHGQCFAQLRNKPDMLHAFLSLLAKRPWPVRIAKKDDRTMDAPICALRKAESGSEFDSRKPLAISPDMPAQMRSLCSFEHETNINERRLPRAIRQVKCICNESRDKQLSWLLSDLACEPLYYEIPSQATSAVQLGVDRAHKTIVET
ncbi:interleukin-17 domain-containing protein [Ditylenchus destructor]|nr:interleukin-17 domain-containing protein [Ditylenchus destructor]